MIIKYKAGQRRGRIELPDTVAEITFGQFIDFKQSESAFFEAEELIDRYAAMMEAAAHIAKGNIDPLPITGKDDEISIEFIYRYIVGLINSYNPEASLDAFSFRVAHHGEVFEVAGNADKIMTGFGLTAGEVIEVMEYRRRAGRMTTEIDAGNIGFSLGLSELAILLRKPGEKLPVSKAERTTFIEERRKLFEDLPMDAVLNVRFFLTLKLLKSGERANTITFSTAFRKTGDGRRDSNGRPRSLLKLFGTHRGTT